jgi:hypothetical protein
MDCKIVAGVSAVPTFEGETYVLSRQYYRYLLKRVPALEAGKPMPGNVSDSVDGCAWYHVATLANKAATTETSNPFTAETTGVIKDCFYL